MPPSSIIERDQRPIKLPAHTQLETWAMFLHACETGVPMQSKNVIPLKAA